MKLSEAIRLGALLKPQAFGDYSVGATTCAIGAACEAIGLAADDEDHVPPQWQLVLETDEPCPVCGYRQSDHYLNDGVVPHLNDDHRWTREQIADWVETIEAQTPSGVSVERDAEPAVATVGAKRPTESLQS